MTVADKLAALRRALEDLEAVVGRTAPPRTWDNAVVGVGPAPGKIYFSADQYDSVATEAERHSRAAAEKLQQRPRESFVKRAQRLADRVQGLRGMNDSAWCNLVTLAAEEFEEVANEVSGSNEVSE